MARALNNIYRYEHKYVIDKASYFTIRKRLSRSGFLYHHEMNVVNNIYYDTLEYKYLYENIDGLADRVKYRFRWYGDPLQTSNGTYEAKVKDGNVNYKIQSKLKDLDIDILNPPEIKKQIMARISKKDQLILQRLHTTLINKYHREYFLTKGQIRLTIDTEIAYMNPANVDYGYLHDPNIIVEIKSPTEIVLPLKMFQDLNLVLGKNSKYVNGVLRTKSITL